jgi:hypothetical protein
MDRPFDLLAPRVPVWASNSLDFEDQGPVQLKAAGFSTSCAGSRARVSTRGQEHYTRCFQKIVVSHHVPSGNSA